MLSGHQWEEKDILIAVKTYPDPGRIFSESGCICGVSDGRWIRLYPLIYRHLPYRIMFRTYDIIRARVEKHAMDPRPESFRPDSDAIERIFHLDSADNWQKRKEYLLPAADESMCEIHRLQKSERKSIGMFKPREVKDLIITRAKDRKGSSGQLSLERRLNPVVQIPYTFTYHFKCEDRRCRGHKMKSVDWEIARLYRKLQAEYRGHPPLVEEKIRGRFLEQMFGPKRESYFCVGNMRSNPQRFVILGLFSPPGGTN